MLFFFFFFFFCFYFFCVFLGFIFLFCVFRFSCFDFFVFYFSFEFIFLLMFFFVAGWGYRLERVQASFYMVFYTLVVSFPFLIYLILFGLNRLWLNFFFFSHFVDFYWWFFV